MRFASCCPLSSGGRTSDLNRSGVALVIVLGLLALLMITGVSFTILMRIERSGASNLRHTSAARQMAKGGIAYAIAALNHNIGTNRYPDWPDRLFRNEEGRTSQEREGRVVDRLRLPEDIFLSVLENEDEPLKVASARVMSGEAAQYLPAALRHRAEMIRQNDEDYAAPEWIPVVARNTIVGRYAYVVLNTSGLLDANLVQSTLTNRWLGGSPSEIRIDRDVQYDVVNAADFATQRKTHGRYETLPELSRKNTGLDGAALANFDVFSYSVPDLMPKRAAIPEMQGLHDTLRTRTQGRRIDISTEAKIRAQRDNILLAFQAAGLKDNPSFNAATAKWAYLGLLDYVDANNDPAWVPVPGWGTQQQQQWARPATEAMPLFSQAIVFIQYEYGEVEEEGIQYATHRMIYRYGLGYSYPFQTQTGPFNLEGEIICLITPDDGDGDWAPLAPAGIERVPLAMNAVNCGPGNDATVVISQPFSYPPANEPPLKLLKAKGKFPGKVEMFAGARTRNSGNTIIRQLPVEDYGNLAGSGMVGLTAIFTADDIADAIGGGFTLWCEALDPRHNHEDGVAFWRASRDDTGFFGAGDDDAPLDKLDKNDILPDYSCPDEPFTGGYNSLTEHMLTTPSTLKDYFRIYTDGIRIGGDVTHCDPIGQQVRAHVADRPLLSAGELGYLPIGFWLTIHLFDHGHNPANLINNNYPNNRLPAIGYHPVLDYFVIGDPNKGKRGRVNLNTVNAEVMGAVFNRLPLQTELHTHTPAVPGPVIAAEDATMLAEWLIDKGPFERLSELGRFFDDTDQLGVKNVNAAYNDPDPIRALLNSTRARGGFSEFEREALIRNACELFTLRGQTFTIILRADAFAPRFGMTGVKQGNVLATATAVAQVWRDTEPMITQSRDPVNNRLVYTYNYPTFVQFFKILNE